MSRVIVSTATRTVHVHATGLRGLAGVNGADGGLPYLFGEETDTEEDPGAGRLRLNNASAASVTEIAVSDETAAVGNPDVAALLLAAATSTSDVKGHVTILKAGAPETFAVYAISGATDADGWVRLAVTHVASAGTFADDDALQVVFARTGDKGNKGDKGDKGDKGNPGQDGSAATIAVGTVTTLDPEQSAIVENVGTENAAVLNFGIPKGEKGDQGEPGETPEIIKAPRTVTDSSYTFVADDALRMVEGNSAYPQVFSVPADVDVSFDPGTRIDVAQIGTGQVQVAPSDGVSLRFRTGRAAAGQFAILNLIKRAADDWLLGGDATDDLVHPLADLMLAAESEGLAFSFVDDFFAASGHYGSARVKDTSTPANNYNSHPFGLLTYAGASKKWVRGPNGLWFLSDFANDLPFEWDESGKLLGIRVEEQRVSRALKSRRLDDQTFWTATNITPSAVEGVDGVTGSATRITATDDGGTILGSTNTASSAARRLAPFIRRVAGTGNLEWTLDGGSTWTAFTEEITSSFKRIGVGATVANPRIGFRIASNGDAFDIDFANGEDGAFDTSPLESTDSHVTRAADNILLATSMFPFNAAAGTVFAEADERNSAGQPNVVEISNGTLNERLIVIYRNTIGNIAIVAVDGGATQVNTEVGSRGASAFKVAACYAENNYAGCINGGSVAEDTNATLATGTRINIGSAGIGAGNLGGYMRSLVYTPRRMSNAELQEITS